MKPAILAWIVVAIGILTANTAAHAPLPDLDSCHDDLDRVRRDASDASDAAEDAKSKHDEFEDCEEDPKLNGGCSSQRLDYGDALGELQSKMDDLDNRLRSVETSCEYNFTINRMSPVEASQRHLEAAQRRFCTSVKRLVSLGMTPDNALQLCRASANEQACRACLGMK